MYIYILRNSIGGNMPRLSRFQIMQHFKKNIEEYFNQSPQKVYTFTDVEKILIELKLVLALPSITTTNDFIKFLADKKILSEVKIEFPKKNTYRYLKGDISIYELAASLDKDAYFSHYSAMFMHNLTDNIPKNVFINKEQKNKTINEDVILHQSSIDRAFSNQMRTTNQIAKVESYNCNIYLLNGKNVDRLGVIDHELSEGIHIPITDIERTLIDITVRPNYAGGVQEVLGAYIAAKDRVSINRLVSLLKKIKYIYPYHQAIGFYLEKAGYKESVLKLLEKLGIEHNFYLTYQIKEKDFSDRWKLYFPKGL